MKMPKGFNKWTVNEQEAWLVDTLQQYYAVQNQISKMLAKLRGGQRLQIKDVDRPDEALLKS